MTDGERLYIQMRLHSITHHSPPTVRPGTSLWPRGLGPPVIKISLAYFCGEVEPPLPCKEEEAF